MTEQSARPTLDKKWPYTRHHRRVHLRFKDSAPKEPPQSGPVPPGDFRRFIDQHKAAREREATS